METLRNRFRIGQTKSPSGGGGGDDDDDDDSRENENPSGNAVVSERVENVEDSGGEMVVDRAPDDDCCPICFGNFTIPCKANCGHWYCASCILQFWNYSAASKPCKCPMCSRYIIKLTPEGSLQGQQEEEVTEVLKNVQRYNRLFVGGARGLVQKLRELPLFIKRIIRQMMDPDRPETYFNEARLFAMTLSVLYVATPFDFIPTGGVGIVRVFDYAAVALVIILRLVGIYQRRLLNQRVRRLAAAQPLQE